MNAPYYADEWVTLYHGDCREVLAGMAGESVAAVLTDPPYTERTHRNATSNKVGAKDHPLRSAFASITDDDLRALVSEMGRVSNGWVIATLDYRHAVEFDVTPPPGVKVQRLGVWVKTNPTPQITGDRPAQGWEAIAYMHLDPFAGSGTTLRAAKDEGSPCHRRRDRRGLLRDRRPSTRARRAIRRGDSVMNDNGVVRMLGCVLVGVLRPQKPPVVADLPPGPSTGFLLPDAARGVSADYVAQRGGSHA